MFAPKHHQAMAHVIPVRKELAVRTIFNLLGPLTNPAGARRQLLGVSDRTFQETIAEALLSLGCDHAMVVSADDGLDELSIADRTRVVEVADGRTDEWFVEAQDLGLGIAPLETIAGGDPDHNAGVTRSILEGERGPQRDVALLNAGAAVFVGGGAVNLGDGVEQARQAVDSGAARDVLARLVDRSRELAGAS
jgi:anthranilate phosphoribosyltransferase